MNNLQQEGPYEQAVRSPTIAHNKTKGLLSMQSHYESLYKHAYHPLQIK